ncbi:MAG: hypothetical protein ACOVOR_02215 [Rhabdochlamydiaceae bacterium]
MECIFYSIFERDLITQAARYYPTLKYFIVFLTIFPRQLSTYDKSTTSPKSGLTNLQKNVYGLEPSLIEIVFVARKRIHPGCQLLIDYGQNYWARLGVDPFPLLENTYRLDSNLNFV